MAPDVRKGLAACAIVLATFAAGRFSAPEHVKIEVQTIEVKSHAEDQRQTLAMTLDRDQHREVVVTQVQRPDGTRETTTRTVSDSEQRQHSEASQERASSDRSSKESIARKEVVRSGGRLDIALLAGPRLSLSAGVGPLIYGVHVSRPLIGPLTVGLFGMSNAVAGVSVGLQF